MEPNQVSCRWDHKTKPSTFIVTKEGKEVYRGPYREGYDLYMKLSTTIEQKQP